MKTNHEINQKKRTIYANRNLAPHKPWNDDDDNFILSAFESMSDREIAKVLGRTMDSVRAQRKRLQGIKAVLVPKELLRLKLWNYVFVVKKEIRL